MLAGKSTAGWPLLLGLKQRHKRPGRLQAAGTPVGPSDIIENTELVAVAAVGSTTAADIAAVIIVVAVVAAAFVAAAFVAAAFVVAAFVAAAFVAAAFVAAAFVVVAVAVVALGCAAGNSIADSTEMSAYLAGPFAGLAGQLIL